MEGRPGEIWETVEIREGYLLQTMPGTGLYRIADMGGRQAAAGSREEMERRFRELCMSRAAVKPRYGDIVGVHRKNGLYDHYGVYESDSCVYEYGGEESDFEDIMVRTVTFEKFLGGSSSFFILNFPEGSSIPSMVESGDPDAERTPAGRIFAFVRNSLSTLGTAGPVTLYSPEETVARARSRLGERQYDLMLNNCEHFAIWCRTGLSESGQVNALLNFLAAAVHTGTVVLDGLRSLREGDSGSGSAPEDGHQNCT